MTEKKPRSKPKVPDNADDKDQSERFIETARKHESDESRDALDRAFKRIPSKIKTTRSDGT